MLRDIPLTDKNNERNYLIMRAEKIISVLRSRIFSSDTDAGEFEFSPGQDGSCAEEWKSFGRDDYWGGREYYCRFRQTVTIPDYMEGKKVCYEITPFPDSSWDESAQQFIISINGKITQGIDSNHTFVFLSDCAAAGEKYDIYLRAYYDDNSFRGKSQLRGSLKIFHPEVNGIYYDLDNLWRSAHLFGADSVERADIINAMNDACNIIELNLGDGEFYSSCVSASEFLKNGIYGEKSKVLMSAVGHTHIDVAYRWRLRQTREKAGRSFATVLNLMKEYPDYKFMSSQAQLYEYVKQDYPEVYEGIRRAVAEGRWEPEGGLWVEADTNIVSGESLARQFLFGKRFFLDEFGKDNKIMWLPDVFGYSAALPQIMAKSGIEYFMTTKISWNEYTRFPYDTFMWEGIDGTRILSHFISARDTDDADDWNTTYNAHITPEYASFGWKRYSQKNLNKNYLCAFGHGDGGGGPERSELENYSRLSRGIPGIPQVKQEFALDFFRRLEHEVGNNRYLPSWRGELYLEFHRGTLTAQARNKRFNRKAEYLMHDIETLCVLSSVLSGEKYPREEINEIWKLILLNQFHDIIPGSSIENVYKDSLAQYEEIFTRGERLKKSAAAGLARFAGADKNKIAVFNTLGFERSSVAEVDGIPAGDYTVYDENGPLPTQRTDGGKLIFIARNVPSKGYKLFTLKNEKYNGACFAADEKRVETDDYILEFDGNMNISSLYHKKTGRFVSSPGDVLGEITAYEDRSHVYEAWDIKRYYDEKSYPVNNVEKVSVTENGPVRTTVGISRRFGSSTINQSYIFVHGCGRIDIDYDIDWKEKNIALKADYPVDVNTDRATFDIQFGNIERTTTDNTLADYAKFEVCGHKWADISDTSFGFSVLSDCKYGWTVKHGHIRPTLLRSAADPNPSQDRERHKFTYSLYAHSGEVRTSGVYEQAYDLNVPLTAVYIPEKEHCGVRKNGYGLVFCSADNVIIETVKLCEDENAVIIRMYEAMNKRCDAEVKLNFAYSSVIECDLTENDIGDVPCGAGCVRLTVRPFEIRTLKVRL